ncbi:probable E3 ubiquitin-protein ligase MYCBP2 [Microbacterium sp. HM58-2]|nr:probable E3 ubiquitin-protein ligase MYCBP2 [Microbacterium sp. HM58-2]
MFTVRFCPSIRCRGHAGRSGIRSRRHAPNPASPNHVRGIAAPTRETRQRRAADAAIQSPNPRTHAPARTEPSLAGTT